MAKQKLTIQVFLEIIFSLVIKDIPALSELREHGSKK